VELWRPGVTRLSRSTNCRFVLSSLVLEFLVSFSHLTTWFFLWM
jgi:hypothetical protein